MVRSISITSYFSPSRNFQWTTYINKIKYPSLLAVTRLASDPDFVGLVVADESVVVADVSDDDKVLEGDAASLAVAAVVCALTVLDTAEEEVAEEAAAGASEVAASPEESAPDAASFVGFLHDPNTA